MDGFKAQFPNLFEDYILPNGALRMRFELGDDFPAHLTGTVKMVANVGDKYIALRSPDGWWEPGGKPELVVTLEEEPEKPSPLKEDISKFEAFVRKVNNFFKQTKDGSFQSRHPGQRLQTFS